MQRQPGPSPGGHQCSTKLLQCSILHAVDVSTFPSCLEPMSLRDWMHAVQLPGLTLQRLQGCTGQALTTVCNGFCPHIPYCSAVPMADLVGQQSNTPM